MDDMFSMGSIGRGLITDEATMALLGTYATLLIRDSAGTTVVCADCLCRGPPRRETHDDLAIVDAIISAQGCRRWRFADRAGPVGVGVQLSRRRRMREQAAPHGLQGASQ
ncbi:MAG: hypothetical protein HZB16_17785 [Armatimonadetes bacterium]|nr:hypothetical protein [Armatimonadota bacterium]